MVVVLAVAFPVRAAVARAEVRWLEHQWLAAQSDDRARADAESRMMSYLPVTDPAPVTVAIAAVERDELGRYRATAQRLRGARMVDNGVGQLRSRLLAAVTHRADLLARVVAWYDQPVGASPPESSDDQTTRDTAAADHQLAASQVRWSVTASKSLPVAKPYPAATAELGRLSHWLDRPLGIALVSVVNSHLTRIDIDGSRTVPLGGPSVDGPLVLRRGYVAFVSGTTVWAVAPDGSGAPRRLATGSSVFAAADPGALWVEDHTVAGTAATAADAGAAATEIDGSGTVVRGPIAVAGDAVDATATALIVYPPDQSAIEVRNLSDQTVQCRLGSRVPSDAGVPYELAARGDLVAWVDVSNRVHVTDARTCADVPGVAQRTGTPLQATPSAAAAFSPDGRTLALAASDQDIPGHDVYFLQLIDLADATTAGAAVNTTTVPVRSGFPISTMAWTADGSRLFWLSGGPIGVSAAISTWRSGDAAVQPLRVFDLGLAPTLTVIP